MNSESVFNNYMNVGASVVRKRVFRKKVSVTSYFIVQ